jgi:hypothetical protein
MLGLGLALTLGNTVTSGFLNIPMFGNILLEDDTDLLLEDATQILFEG